MSGRRIADAKTGQRKVGLDDLRVSVRADDELQRDSDNGDDDPEDG